LTVAVTPSSSSCTWTATSNDTWITINSGSSGTGSGTVNYSYAANTTTSARTGTMTIAGQTFTLNQSTCGTDWLTLNPVSRDVTSAGGNFSVSWTAISGCGHMPWSAASNNAWITGVSPTSGTGSGSVSYTVAVNTGTTSRPGTLTIASKTHTVNEAPSCTYSLSPTSNPSGIPPGGSGLTVAVTPSSSSCTWTATKQRHMDHD